MRNSKARKKSDDVKCGLVNVLWTDCTFCGAFENLL